MSKSEKNGVDPQEIIDRYGADTARLFVIFAGPPDESAVWSDEGAKGRHRFLRRLWAYAEAHVQPSTLTLPTFDWSTASEPVRGARREIHHVLEKVNDDYARVKYNNIVSAADKMLNALEGIASDAAEATALADEGLSILLRVIYPVAPHTTWVLWNELGYNARIGELLDAPWPRPDPAALKQNEIELVLQVNGKLRGKLVVPATADESAIKAHAIAAPEVAKHSNGAPVKFVKVVPGRLVNVVV